MARKTFQDVTGTEKLGLDLYEVTRLLVRFPVTTLAFLAAVKSWCVMPEVLGNFLTDTAGAVSSSWFGADGTSGEWRIGGSHGSMDR